jgi:hypothetical protein
MITFTMHQCALLHNELNWATKYTKMHSKQDVTVSVYQRLCCISQRSVEVWSMRTMITVASWMQVINHHYEAAWVYRPAQLWLCRKVVRVVTGSPCSIFITIYIRLPVTVSIKQPFLHAITAVRESNITPSTDRDELHTCKTYLLNVRTDQSNEIDVSKNCSNSRAQGHVYLYITFLT